MSSFDSLKEVGESLVGLAGMAVNFVTPMLRHERSHWGVSETEAQSVYAGDDLVAEPRWGWTHAVYIDAPPEEVWPWVVQIGQSKGGFYSYQFLENVGGVWMDNADVVHPEWQNLKVGDVVRLHERFPLVEVVSLRAGAFFVVHARADLMTGLPVPVGQALPDRWVNMSWLFQVSHEAGGDSRLFSRFRVNYSDDLATRVEFGPGLQEPVGFMMDRKMLLGIKERVEADRKRRQAEGLD